MASSELRGFIFFCCAHVSYSCAQGRVRDGCCVSRVCVSPLVLCPPRNILFLVNNCRPSVLSGMCARARVCKVVYYGSCVGTRSLRYYLVDNRSCTPPRGNASRNVLSIGLIRGFLVRRPNSLVTHPFTTVLHVK